MMILLYKVEAYNNLVCELVKNVSKKFYEHCKTARPVFGKKTVDLLDFSANDDNVRKSIRMTNPAMSYKERKGVVKRIHVLMIVLGMFTFFLAFTGNIIGVVLLIVIIIVGFLILSLISARKASNSSGSPSLL